MGGERPLRIWSEMMVSNVRLFRRLAMGIAALVLSCAAVQPAAASSIVPSYIYGIADDNQIWQINPIPGQQSFESTYNTGLTGQSNAVAFDRGRDQLLFLDVSNNLYLWNKPLGGSPAAFQQITTSGSLGISSSLVYNASYYNDGFWFFKEGTNQLVKASLTYSGTAVGTVPTFSGTTPYTVAGAPNDVNNGFGDIAINVNTGILYAATSSGLFYSVDLSDPSSTYTQIKGLGGNISLQLSFNEDYSILYGHNYASGAWYTVDLATGNLTDLGYTTIVPGTSAGFRDLGGASAVDVTPSSVPEIDPGSFASAFALLAGALAWLERRRLSAIAAS
jgi:hypothetical protein